MKKKRLQNVQYVVAIDGKKCKKKLLKSTLPVLMKENVQNVPKKSDANKMCKRS